MPKTKGTQSFDALEGVLSGAPLAQGVESRGSRQEEQQLHVPHRDEREHLVEGLPEMLALHVEGVGGVEDPRGVEGKEQQDGQYSEPVDVVHAGLANRTGVRDLSLPLAAHGSPPHADGPYFILCNHGGRGN